MYTVRTTLFQAVRAIHQPRDWADVEAAKRRLAFEELLLLQLKLLLRREIERTPRSEADLEGTRVTQRDMMEAGRDVLGFRLTAAQDRVLTEVPKVCAWS
jgi:ATP-dependent DNA helicase RecG